MLHLSSSPKYAAGRQDLDGISEKIFEENWVLHRLIVLQERCPRLAIEIKWNSKRMPKKDHNSLKSALSEMQVNKAYFISVGPDITKKSYAKTPKRPDESHRLHEIPVGLGFKSSTAKLKTKLWKKQRHLLGRNMRLGRARVKRV